MKTQNVAFNRTVLMSSEHNPPYHDPKYAVDGKVVLDGEAAQCSHTQGQYNPWIIVDLGAIYNVKYVTLFNRIDDAGKNVYQSDPKGCHYPTCTERNETVLRWNGERFARNKTL